VVGGNFTTLNGVNSYGVGAVDAGNGALRPWLMNKQLQDYGSGAAVDALASDGNVIYGAGFNVGGNRAKSYEGTWSANPSDGSLRWLEDCHGDTYSVFAANGTVYAASHAHYCGNVGGWPNSSTVISKRITAWTPQVMGALRHERVGTQYEDYGGTPSPSLFNWWPDFQPGNFTGKTQAVWNLAGNGRYLLAGGEFVSVNGRPQQGLTRFALRGTTGNPGRVGPTLSGDGLKPTTTVSGTAVKVAFTSDYDNDDMTLTYRISRNGRTVWTHRSQSTFWIRPVLSFTDTGLASHTSYTYRVTATDPHGNVVQGTPVTVTTG
jgi:hypothetical protein